VKRTIKVVRAKRLSNFKCQAVLVGSWNNTHTTTRLPRWKRLGKPASLYVTTGFLAINFYAGQDRKPPYRFLHQGNPILLHQTGTNGSKFGFPPLFAYHKPTRGRVFVQLCAELVVFLGPISYRGHLTALISPFQHSSRISLSATFSQHSLSHATTFNVIQLTHSFDSVASTAFSLDDL